VDETPSVYCKDAKVEMCGSSIKRLNVLATCREIW